MAVNAQTRDPQIDLVQRVCEYIESRLGENPTLNEIGEFFNISPFHLQRTFKRITGLTPRQYAEGHRLEFLKARLRDGEPVTSALYTAGFGSSSRLYESAPEKMGMTPKVYSRGGEGMHIRYSIVDSHLGRMLVGMTDRGICAVDLGSDDAGLEANLRREYPRATIERNREDMCEWVEALMGHLCGERPHLHLPVDVQATAFQLKVWTALQSIPYGETRTYRQIAEAIGQPKAARAVAAAVAANPVICVIPCHRAVREDGSPSSYYSSERTVNNKHILLDNEQQHLPPQS